MELALGPILFEWKRDDVLGFYEEAATMAVDRVYLGEVVCFKKRGLQLRDVEAIASRLAGAGKKVAVSTLAVVSNEDELRLVRDVCSLGLPVEANDMSVFNIIGTGAGAAGQREIIAGPHITAYNADTVALLKGLGARRVVFPVELPRDSVAHNIREGGVEGEVFAHGKVPLAFSWRCYSSRAYGLTKSTCRHDCGRYPDGLEIRSMDREPVFTVNGTSVLSANTYSLVEAVEDLGALGVAALRVSPDSRFTGGVVDIFRKRIAGVMGPDEGVAAIRELTGAPLSNGWYFGRAGREYVAASAASGQ